MTLQNYQYLSNYNNFFDEIFELFFKSHQTYQKYISGIVAP